MGVGKARKIERSRDHKNREINHCFSKSNPSELELSWKITMEKDKRERRLQGF